MSLLTPSQFLDDRGAQVRRRDAEIISNISGSHVSDTERAVGVIVALLPLLVPALPLVYLYITTRAIGPGICMALPLLPVGIGIRALVLRHMRPLAGSTLSIPTVLAYGHCGACGYRLAGIPAELDDRIRCPECGGAWHRDRMPLAYAGNKQAVAALRRASISRTRSDVGWFDDRKVVLSRSYRWPRGVLRSVTPAHAEAAAARKMLNRKLGVPRMVTVAGLWIFGGLFTAMLLATREMTLGEGAGAIGAAAGVCAVIHVLIRFALLPHETVRATLLHHRCCPSCWGVLERRLVDFDGRTRCPDCRASWNIMDVSHSRTSTPPPGSPPPLPASGPASS